MKEIIIEEMTESDLKYFETCLLTDFDEFWSFNVLKQDFKTLMKEHKALEIIKAHSEQLLDIIDTDNYNEYLDLDYAPNQYISEKQYDLLKEVLLWDIPKKKKEYMMW